MSNTPAAIGWRTCWWKVWHVQVVVVGVHAVSPLFYSLNLTLEKLEPEVLLD